MKIWMFVDHYASMDAQERAVTWNMAHPEGPTRKELNHMVGGDELP